MTGKGLAVRYRSLDQPLESFFHLFFCRNLAMPLQQYSMRYGSTTCGSNTMFDFRDSKDSVEISRGSLQQETIIMGT